MINFKLRPFKTTDAESLAKHANNPNIAKNLTDQFPHPYNIEDANSFIEMVTTHDPTQVFAVEIDGRAVGGIGLHTQTDIYSKNMELGYWLAEPYWGNGIISSAIEQIVEYGFEKFPITRIYARPYGTNKASQRVLEKAGFELEAHLKKTIFKNGEFLDELIFGIRK